DYENAVKLARDALGEAVFDGACAGGRALSLDDAADLARAAS
ncbi:MAG: hypothetical protein QOC87_2208, partial [Actinomycetota bacterium]|nr:hypothetical protein [Actinomycetota bacterium]